MVLIIEYELQSVVGLSKFLNDNFLLPIWVAPGKELLHVV